MSFEKGGYFGVKDIWNGEKNAVGPQSGFWNKIDAIGVFFMRFEVILWIVSIIISIVAIIFAKDAKDQISNSSNGGSGDSTN